MCKLAVIIQVRQANSFNVSHRNLFLQLLRQTAALPLLDCVHGTALQEHSFAYVRPDSWCMLFKRERHAIMVEGAITAVQQSRVRPSAASRSADWLGFRGTEKWEKQL
jgi:hypothetical protein